jgi:DNA-binding response OmpR family regulator
MLRAPLGASQITDPIVALLVDRDDDTRSMYAEYLRLAHYDIEEAADGREALAKAFARRPGVIVTETRLPGIDGFDLCRLLRSDAATSRTPILVVTADAYAREVERARAAGANEVLIKPCLPELLLANIRQVVRASAELRERSRLAVGKADEQLSRAVHLLDEAGHSRPTLVRAHNRRQTTTPPLAPPTLKCPSCDAMLAYDHSHIGGVSERNMEQWDYFVCPRGCGTFQYRQRTRRLRKM